MRLRESHLYSILDSFSKVLVAYSGGVDSACLLHAAYQRLGERVVGIIADSPSLPRAELKAALDLSRSMGVQIEVIQTEEFSDLNYLSNPVNRCYFCKHALFSKMEQIAFERGFPVLAYGENADDLTETRPGNVAAVKFQIRAPLKEAGLTKANVRALSARWGLPTADKPASPCLSSRIPHGTPVTTNALAQIETGEAAIRALGFRVFRLRHHGSRALLEFAPDEIGRTQSGSLRKQIVQAVITAGYSEVEIEPNGYGSAINPG